MFFVLRCWVIMPDGIDVFHVRFVSLIYPGVGGMFRYLESCSCSLLKDILSTLTVASAQSVVLAGRPGLIRTHPALCKDT